MANIKTILDNIDKIYNRKLLIMQLSNKEININDIQHVNQIQIKHIPVVNLPLINIPDDGNCFYEAIARPLRTNVVALRNLVANNLSEETLKQHLKISLYFCLGKSDIQGIIRSHMEFGVAKKALLSHCQKIIDKLNNKTEIEKEIKAINPKNFIDIYIEKDIQDYLSPSDYNAAMKAVRNIIKISKSEKNQGVTYLDEEFELPFILNEYDIVILDLHKPERTDYYDSIKIHKPIHITDETRYIIVTTEGSHTNLIYNKSFKFHELPKEFMEKIEKIK